MVVESGTKKDVFDPVLLLFALGGDVLAFYELRSMAQLMQKFAVGFPELDEETLRGLLEGCPCITTSNGNYFTCRDSGLYRMAMDYLAVPGHADIINHILAWLPCLNTDGTVNQARLTRDVRNSLFAKDFKLHKKSLEQLSSKMPEDFALGKPYWFLADGGYLDWLGSLPVEFLSVCIRQLVPYMVHHVKPIDGLLSLVLPRFHELMGFAQFPLVDALIAVGRQKEAEDYLRMMLNADGNALATRWAWLDFLHGNNQAAIAAYTEALENLQRPNYGNEFYFPTITGVFFIFALIRDNTPASYGLAYTESKIGVRNPLFGRTYRALNGYIDHIRRGTPVDEVPLSEPCLDTLAICLVHFWMHEDQGSDVHRQALAELKGLAEVGGYRWLVSECEELERRQGVNWIPAETACGDGDSAPLVECVRILPNWTQDLNSVTSTLNEYWGMKPMRAAWQISFSPDCPTNVVLDLYEQHLTKTDKWSKGHHLLLEKLARDVRSLGWPMYFTAQDIRVVTMLLTMDTGGMDGAFQEMLPEGLTSGQAGNVRMTHNDILLNLLDYPRLFWADDSEQEPVKVILDEPYVQIVRETEGKIRLSLLPKVDSQSCLSAVRYDDSTLHLFCFKQVHRRLKEALGDGVCIPERAVEHINDTCLKLAKLMRVKSDFSLDGLNLSETRLMPARAVMRLERKVNGLGVELLMQPWGEQEALLRPGEGARAILECRDGRLVRKLRDEQAESELVAKVLDGCTALSSASQEGAWCWLIENGENVFQFMMQLRELMDVCKVQWKQDKKISLSRRISFGDVAVRAQSSNNWLDVDGEVVIDETMTLTFQKLLELSKNQKGTFITLDDGQVISLADEFRACLDTFNNMGLNRKGRLQFNQLALPILQLMLDGFSQVKLSKEWEEQLSRIDEAQALEFSVPPQLAAGTVLRDYQLAGVKWLIQLDHWGAGACLADDMGLGKTIQAITFMLAKAEEGPSLVVAPTSVCANWVDEINRFAPTLKTVVFGQGDREEMLRSMQPGMVMISSYGLLQSQIQCFETAAWRVVVLDEAQAIKNYQAKRSQAALQLNAKFRIATTGTPIENNLNELWTLFQFITPGLFGTRQMFQDKFTNPVERDKNAEALQRLNTLIRPFLLRRKKDEVLKELPPKTEVQLHVDLSAEERAFYEAVRQNLLKDLDEMRDDNPGQQKIRILAAIMKLRQAACNPLLIEPGTKIRSSKLEEFKTLVQDLVAGGHKTLVFSQFVKHLDIVRPCLKALNITYEYLDGSTPTRDREEAVRNFQDGKSDLFLISLRAGGLGLNLTRADYVIILDPWWNPAVEDQAADRAHRLGQQRPVTIYRIIARDTIEDKILELHKHKQDLAVQLLDGSDTAEAISAEELLKLLQEAHD